MTSARVVSGLSLLSALLLMGCLYGGSVEPSLKVVNAYCDDDGYFNFTIVNM